MRLAFRSDLVEPILRGEKTQTYRRSRPRVERGDTITATVGGKPFAELTVESVQLVSLSGIQNATARREGYKDAHDLRESVQKTYPDLLFAWRIGFTVEAET